MTNPKKDKKCTFCNIRGDKIAKGTHEKSILVENEQHLVIVNNSPVKSKASLLVITKDHCKDIFEITQGQWNGMLPVIQHSIERVDKVYKPVGYALYIVAGDNSKFHFHLHIIPKYKKNYGPCRSKEKDELVPDRKKAYQRATERLGAKNGLIGENDEAISRLVPQEEALCEAHIIIKPKKSIPNDINAIDQETWNQMGELLLSELKDMKERYHWGKDLLALRVWIPLGKMTGPSQTDISEFQIEIVTRFSNVWDQIPGPDNNEGKRMKKFRKGKENIGIGEHARIAEKLRNPDKHAKQHKQQRERERENIWKQPSTYWLIASGAGIVLLGWGIYWMVKKKSK